MRILSYILMAVGIFLLTSDGYDEIHGVTGVPVMFGSGSYPLTFDSEDIIKKDNPETFHDAMVCHWAQASMIAIAGFILFMIDRKQERLDPLSPNFRGTKALDELDEEMKNEEEQHKNPKR
jgi:hypothetical protein